MSADLDDAAARVREAGGPELLERLVHIDRVRAAPARPERERAVPTPTTDTACDFDVVIVGGGLSLLFAPVLAAKGLRVAIADRARVGQAHREWNAGQAELDGLVDAGLASRSEIDALVVNRYREGVCRWFRGGSYPVRHVLDHAIDAERLLHLARQRAEASGVVILDRHTLVAHSDGPTSAALCFIDASGADRVITARIIVEARGAQSPFARADLACPTVGGVLHGLAEGEAPNEIAPDVGEILATTEDIEDGRQHLWEAFPGRAGETTTYLFYYARQGEEGSLLSLYSRFFRLLPRYKRGDARLLRPTFGVIPGWSRIGAPAKAPSDRWVLVGDAAARHSPLTFCGFGAFARGLAADAEAIAAKVRGERAAESRDPFIHTATGALALVMASASREPKRAGEMNDLLNDAFASLHAQGDAFYGRLLRDEMGASEFISFLRATAARRPRVYRDVATTLPPRVLLGWGFRLSRNALFA